MKLSPAFMYIHILYCVHVYGEKNKNIENTVGLYHQATLYHGPEYTLIKQI